MHRTRRDRGFPGIDQLLLPSSSESPLSWGPKISQSNPNRSFSFNLRGVGIGVMVILAFENEGETICGSLEAFSVAEEGSPDPPLLVDGGGGKRGPVDLAERAPTIASSFRRFFSFSGSGCFSSYKKPNQKLVVPFLSTGGQTSRTHKHQRTFRSPTSLQIYQLQLDAI